MSTAARTSSKKHTRVLKGSWESNFYKGESYFEQFILGISGASNVKGTFELRMYEVRAKRILCARRLTYAGGRTRLRNGRHQTALSRQVQLRTAERYPIDVCEIGTGERDPHSLAQPKIRCHSAIPVSAVGDERRDQDDLQLRVPKRSRNIGDRKRLHSGRIRRDMLIYIKFSFIHPETVFRSNIACILPANFLRDLFLFSPATANRVCRTFSAMASPWARASSIR